MPKKTPERNKKAQILRDLRRIEAQSFVERYADSIERLQNNTSIMIADAKKKMRKIAEDTRNATETVRAMNRENAPLERIEVVLLKRKTEATKLLKGLEAIMANLHRIKRYYAKKKIAGDATAETESAYFNISKAIAEYKRIIQQAKGSIAALENTLG